MEASSIALVDMVRGNGTSHDDAAAATAATAAADVDDVGVGVGGGGDGDIDDDCPQQAHTLDGVACGCHQHHFATGAH